jgi:predicted nucleic acid-binding protein
VWLERLLNQERAEEVRQLLDSVVSESFYITDFSFHSIGVILCRLNKHEILTRFVQDIFIYGAVNLIHLEPYNISHIVNIINQFNLDFDDAYQYVAAEKYNLTIVSFDADFDRCEKGRKTPIEILKEQI